MVLTGAPLTALPLVLATDIFGIRLVGVTVDTGKKLLFTAMFIAGLWLLQRVLHGIAFTIQRNHAGEQTRFWTRQIISLSIAILLLVGLLSIWFNDPSRLATALGLVSAGLAFTLQRVITSLAGYFVILRGKTFNVGDRISMGGVRGDVIALGFIQTTLMTIDSAPSRSCWTAPHGKPCRSVR